MHYSFKIISCRSLQVIVNKIRNHGINATS